MNFSLTKPSSDWKHRWSSKNRTKRCRFFTVNMSPFDYLTVTPTLWAQTSAANSSKNTVKTESPCSSLAEANNLPPLSCFSATLLQHVCQVSTTLSLLLWAFCLILSYFSATAGPPWGCFFAAASTVNAPEVKKKEIFNLLMILFLTCLQKLQMMVHGSAPQGVSSSPNDTWELWL